MSTSTQDQQSPQDPAISEILDFWFGMTPKDWFMEASKWDAEITQRFGALVEKARLTSDLDESWTSTPAGSLALILLLDQFTRNIYRPGNHPEPGLSWSGDFKALQIATTSIAKGYDRAIQSQYSSSSGKGKNHRIFFYLPFMHAEDMSSQIASCALFEAIARECEVENLQHKLDGTEESESEKSFREYSSQAVEFAAKHRDCVAQLGRFPARNKPLGREHTKEEERFLEEHPQGF